MMGWLWELIDTSKKIKKAKGELRNNAQAVKSGARVMRTMSGAIRMVKHEQ